jgi:MFS family permease
MGIKGLDMPVATVVALNFLPLVAASYGWRASFAASTLLLLASTAVFILLFEDRPLGNSAAKMFEGLWNRQMWLLGAVWCFVNMGTIAYSTWAGTFFLQLKGVPAHLAFFMAGILMLTALPLNPVVGTLSDRLGKRKIFITLSMALMGVSFTLIAFLSLPLLFSAVVLLGFSAFYAPVIFASTSELLPEEKAGLGFSILFTCGFAGTFLGPFLVGYIQDAFPGGTPSFLAMAVFSVSALMCSRLLKVR